MKKPDNIVVDFAQKAGFDKVDFFSTLKDYDVYVAVNDGEITYTGYPVFILYGKDIRFSTEDETFEILDIHPVVDANFDGEIL